MRSKFSDKVADSLIGKLSLADSHSFLDNLVDFTIYKRTNDVNCEKSKALVSKVTENIKALIDPVLIFPIKPVAKEGVAVPNTSDLIVLIDKLNRKLSKIKEHGLDLNFEFPELEHVLAVKNSFIFLEKELDRLSENVKNVLDVDIFKDDSEGKEEKSEKLNRFVEEYEKLKGIVREIEEFLSVQMKMMDGSNESSGICGL